jgi:hypothetical protein
MSDLIVAITPTRFRSQDSVLIRLRTSQDPGGQAKILEIDSRPAGHQERSLATRKMAQATESYTAPRIVKDIKNLQDLPPLSLPSFGSAPPPPLSTQGALAGYQVQEAQQAYAANAALARDTNGLINILA